MNKETKTSKQQHPPYTAVKNALAGKGLTYKDVANVLGLTEATVQQKLNGGSDFYITEQIKLCETFKLDPALFLGTAGLQNDNRARSQDGIPEH